MVDAKLKRSLDLALIILYGLGNILVAGIYVLIGKIAGSAGDYTPLVFLIAALVAAVTTLSYAGMSARLPLSAAEAVYLHEGFGSILAVSYSRVVDCLRRPSVCSDLYTHRCFRFIITDNHSQR